MYIDVHRCTEQNINVHWCSSIYGVIWSCSMHFEMFKRSWTPQIMKNMRPKHHLEKHPTRLPFNRLAPITGIASLGDWGATGHSCFSSLLPLPELVEWNPSESIESFWILLVMLSQIHLKTQHLEILSPDSFGEQSILEIWSPDSCGKLGIWRTWVPTHWRTIAINWKTNQWFYPRFHFRFFHNEPQTPSVRVLCWDNHIWNVCKYM